MTQKQPEPPDTTIVENRRARFDYVITDTYEAGIALMGTEIKSIRAKQVRLDGAFALIRRGEGFLVNAHVAKYENASVFNHEETRPRKLLLHRQQIRKLAHDVDTQKATLVPLKLYWKNGVVKVLIGFAKGKKTTDKRQTIARREWDRQKHRILKQR